MTYPRGPEADPYIDRASGVLRNHYGITDAHQLERVEADTAALELMRLLERPVPGDFDLAHLQAIHHRLFGRLYPWAGELRRVEMAKEETRFANADFIAAAADGLFRELHCERLLRGLPDPAVRGTAGLLLLRGQCAAPLSRGQRPDAAGLLRPAGAGRRPPSGVGAA
jgi:cell filamentation protein